MVAKKLLSASNAMCVMAARVRANGGSTSSRSVSVSSTRTVPLWKPTTRYSPRGSNAHAVTPPPFSNARVASVILHRDTCFIQYVHMRSPYVTSN